MPCICGKVQKKEIRYPLVRLEGHKKTMEAGKIWSNALYLEGRNQITDGASLGSEEDEVGSIYHVMIYMIISLFF